MTQPLPTPAAEQPTLPVAEVFTSLQGEGPRAGRCVQFVRLGGCNLSCSWCDTPYTWDHTKYDLRQEAPATTLDELMARIEPCLDVVLTGGEPLIHQSRPVWGQLLRRLHAANCPIALETNGTIAPNEVTRTYVAYYSVSPKLPNAGTHRKGQTPALADYGDLRYKPGAALKVVCQSAADVVRACALAEEHGWPLWNVWAMPEGTDTRTLQSRWQEIADAAVAQRINASHRLHVLAWGDTRGT